MTHSEKEMETNPEITQIINQQTSALKELSSLFDMFKKLEEKLNMEDF